jgi:hypothetical protein
MADHTNGTTAGLPPVTRFLALGGYDGATDGVLQCGDGGSVYRFELPADVREDVAVTARERPFDLRPLPPDALDRLTAILSPHSPPRWPGWYFPWQFPSEDVERDVDARVAAVLAEAGPPVWRATTPDHWNLTPLTVRPTGQAVGPR